VGGQAKIWGGHDPPRPPLRIATAWVSEGFVSGITKRIFPGGPKVVKLHFNHSKLKKKLFAENLMENV